jgi:glutamate synthase domain-containing protein 2
MQGVGALAAIVIEIGMSVGARAGEGRSMPAELVYGSIGQGGMIAMVNEKL